MKKICFLISVFLIAASILSFSLPVFSLQSDKYYPNKNVVIDENGTDVEAIIEKVFEEVDIYSKISNWFGKKTDSLTYDKKDFFVVYEEKLDFVDNLSESSLNSEFFKNNLSDRFIIVLPIYGENEGAEKIVAVIEIEYNTLDSSYTCGVTKSTNQYGIEKYRDWFSAHKSEEYDNIIAIYNDFNSPAKDVFFVAISDDSAVVVDIVSNTAYRYGDEKKNVYTIEEYKDARIERIKWVEEHTIKIDDIDGFLSFLGLQNAYKNIKICIAVLSMSLIFLVIAIIIIAVKLSKTNKRISIIKTGKID
jgi:hypothetical protein